MPTRASRHRAPWTAADLKLLKSLRARGVPGAEIARRLGRSRAATYQRIMTEGFNVPPVKTRARGKTRGRRGPRVRGA